MLTIAAATIVAAAVAARSRELGSLEWPLKLGPLEGAALKLVKGGVEAVGALRTFGVPPATTTTATTTIAATVVVAACGAGTIGGHSIVLGSLRKDSMQVSRAHHCCSRRRWSSRHHCCCRLQIRAHGWAQQ